MSMTNKIYLGICVMIFVVVQPLKILAAQPESALQKVESAKTNGTNIQQRNEERITDIRNRIRERKLNISSEVCERRKQRLLVAIPRLANSANTIKSTIDTVYQRVVTFYQSERLADTYNAQIQKIEKAKSEAAFALDIISSYSFELDCQSSTTGEKIDGYRIAIQDARDALKDYRDSTVDLISLLGSSLSRSSGATN